MNQTHKIIFLGTGADDWKEAHVCNDLCRERCKRMKKSGRKNIRLCSSLFMAPDTVIDFTRDTVKALKENNIKKDSIRNIIITHGHSDHFQPLEIIKFASSVPHTLKIFGNSTVKNSLQFCLTHQWDGRLNNFREKEIDVDFQIQTVIPGKPFSIGHTKCTPVLAHHLIDKKYFILEQQALNYIFKSSGKTIFYGLDSSTILPDSFNIISQHQFDICIFDATFGEKEIDPKLSGHQNFPMLKKTVAQFQKNRLLKKNSMIIATHMSRRYVDPYDEIKDKLAKQGIIAAYDGMIIEEF